MLFANSSISVLVATDVAARGLDIADMPCVINVDLPKQTEVFIHRVGRTGRNKNKGEAVTFMTTRQKNLIPAYEDLIHQPIRLSRVTAGARKKMQMPEYQTVMLAAGKRDKMRPGDIVGALTNSAGVNASDIGDINILPVVTYVALKRNIADQAVGRLSRSKIKNKTVKMRLIN